jgi:hypothetical protein
VFAVEHEVGGDDELGAGDVLDAEVGDEAGGGGERPDEKAEDPLERHVAQDVAPAPRPPVLLEDVVLDQLVVEALDGADVGADERDLGGGVGLRVAAEEEPPPPAALLLVAVLARRVQEEGRARGGEQRGLDVGLRFRRAAAALLSFSFFPLLSFIYSSSLFFF